MYEAPRGDLATPSVFYKLARNPDPAPRIAASYEFRRQAGAVKASRPRGRGYIRIRQLRWRSAARRRRFRPTFVCGAAFLRSSKPRGNYHGLESHRFQAPVKNYPDARARIAPTVLANVRRAVRFLRPGYCSAELASVEYLLRAILGL